MFITVFWAELRSRLAVPAAVGLILLLLRVSQWISSAGTGTEPWSQSGAQQVAVVIVLMGLGSALAGLLGSELSGSSREAWGFLLARPLSRERLLLARATADGATLLITMGISLFISGIQIQGVDSSLKLYALIGLLWGILYAASAWAAGMGLSSLGALAVGASWSILGLVTGFGAALGGLILAGGDGLDLFAGFLIRLAGADELAKTQVASPGRVDLLLSAGITLGFLTLVVLAGWVSVWRQRCQPSLLPTRKWVIKSLGILGAVGLGVFGVSLLVGHLYQPQLRVATDITTHPSQVR